MQGILHICNKQTKSFHSTITFLHKHEPQICLHIMVCITRQNSIAAASEQASVQAKSRPARGQFSSRPAKPASDSRKRSRKSVKVEDSGSVNGLPHSLGTALPTPGIDSDDADQKPRKRVNRSIKSAKADRDLEDERNEVDSTPHPAKREPTSKKSPKKTNYGLTPGQSPYPDYLRPTPEECHDVVRLLEKVHGKVVLPTNIPPPSLDVSGCGEVPSVLDALIRTRLSANTTNKNSSTAFQGLVKRFGILTEGVGKGSVDWDAVRRAPQKEVFKAIERGGLADRKSKDIQAILQMVYEENQEQKRAQGAEITVQPVKANHNDASVEKGPEVEKPAHNIISLDHIHLLDTPAAIDKMLTFPGIGPKTASCVALFCLQRPSFAVDTHVFRLCQYLGWVPKTPKKGQPRVDRNTTFSHCDVRIPDALKYPLHQLLIKHGKTCPRCRAVTGQTSAGWENGCVIEHLVKRHGVRKGVVNVQERKKAMEEAGMGQKEAAMMAEAEIKVEEEDGESILSEVSEDDISNRE